MIRKNEETMGTRVARFLGGLAEGFVLCCMILLALCSMRIRVHLGLGGLYWDQITFMQERVVVNTIRTAIALLAIGGIYSLLERVASIKLTVGMLIAWALAALVWILAIGLQSETDFACVIDSSARFAEGDYELLHWGYFRGSSYQLGICLVLESLKRLLPMLNTDLLGQCINVFLSVGFMGMLAVFAQDVLGVKPWTTILLYVLYMPALLYNHYVYGTMPMIFCTALGCLCWARYVKTKKICLLTVMSVALAVGYVLKPNTVVAIIALIIVGILYGLSERDWKPACFAVLAFVGGYALNRLVIAQYEWRAGFPLDENQSLLTWLVMAITPKEGVTPGWYTGYAGEFYDLYLPKEEQQAIVMADLARRLTEIVAHPGEAVRFFTEKILSQWMEPSCSVMAYGLCCDYHGRLNGLAIALFRDGRLNDLTLAYMNVYQQVIYLLSCVGLWQALRHKKHAATPLLPILLIGGLLFHTLMEAKSQYIYPYMVYNMPLAALGLSKLKDMIPKRKTEICS